MCNVIGRHLGSGDIKAAKKTAALALGFGTAIVVAYSGAVLAFGASITALFTEEAYVSAETLGQTHARRLSHVSADLNDS